ncbi:pyrroloquinoline quinone biosynthesis protein PqqB [Muricoccus aerilatus]|uniref:pyrroloquinoline quinone biosynthesis protein PqqB n=1 Tax=Muricoccus aerilatus TaxID=452982 RepID=UPI0005C247B2|nr:pyrroloquinoline quinone biosynthesis protein PqqB [Roseomonas aerilata]
MLRLIVLGAAAGGGFPQWNSASPACLRARAGDPAALPRTQCSLAVSADGERWVLLNAAPELTVQLAANRALHPRPPFDGNGPGAVRHSPLAAVVLTGAEVDTVAGLLSLRERHPFALHATAPSLAVLDANPIFGALNPAIVPRRALPLGEPVALRDAADASLGLTVEAYPVPGKVPLFLETRDEAEPGEEGATIGLAIRASGGPAAHFIPGCAMMTDALRARLRNAALVLFDGTLWRDDEMIRAGAGPKTGARMGHMSISGEAGVIAAFEGLGVRRRILVHLNNTNPVLLEDSSERAAVAAAGWEVAEDGMEITL